MSRLVTATPISPPSQGWMSLAKVVPSSPWDWSSVLNSACTWAQPGKRPATSFSFVHASDPESMFALTKTSESAGTASAALPSVPAAPAPLPPPSSEPPQAAMNADATSTRRRPRRYRVRCSKG